MYSMSSNTLFFVTQLFTLVCANSTRFNALLFNKRKTIILLIALAMPAITSAATGGTLSTAQARPSIMVLGDSLSAAHGIDSDQGWVTLLEQYLAQHDEHKHYRVINASIGGETTGGALSRLPKLLTQYQPSIVIIELGGNDGLRGFPIATVRNNLEQLVTLSQAANARVLLTGMHIPPNYGPRYTQMFYASYGLIAQKYQVSLVPFLLEEVAIYPQLMQTDGIHPTAQAQPRILQNVLPHLKALL